MTAARNTDGVLPATPQKSTAHTAVSTAVDRFPFPSRPEIRPAR